MSSLATQSPTWPDERVERIFAQFKAATVNPEEFNHEAHMLVAWRDLQEDDLLAAIEKYSDALKTLTRKLGVEGKYHETITWFFMLLINQRRIATDASTWTDFRQDNADLFERAGETLNRYYSRELLASERARQHFLLPDQLA